MRLGDLDALKKELRREVSGNRVGVFFAKRVFDIIDNAPTVEPCYQTTSCLDCKNYDKANYHCPRFCGVIRETAKENQRPQGKWIPCYVNFTDGSKPLFAYCKCSLCNKQATGDYKFCPNCGAEMKKGENNGSD